MMITDVMKRSQIDNSGSEDVEPSFIQCEFNNNMENPPKQARVIPVQHESEQWHSHNPYQMPQPRRFAHPGMTQPVTQQHQPSNQPRYSSLAPYPPQHQQMPEWSSNSNTHRDQGQQTERTVPIQVVHQSSTTDRNFQNSKHASQTQTAPKSPQNITVSQAPLISTRPPNTRPDTHSTSNRTPVPASSNCCDGKVPSTNSDKIEDDHRVVEARKKIAAVLIDVEEKEAEANAFVGTRKDKDFIRLEHELTSKLLRLDEVNASGAPGEEEIRSERKAAIKRVQYTLDILELKVMSD